MDRRRAADRRTDRVHHFDVEGCAVVGREYQRIGDIGSTVGAWDGIRTSEPLDVQDWRAGDVGRQRSAAPFVEGLVHWLGTGNRRRRLVRRDVLRADGLAAIGGHW